MALGIEVYLGPGHIVLDGDPASLPKKGGRAPSQFLVHFYCGQTAGCIKMPLGMEVDLGPGDFMLDGDPDPPPRKGGTAAPTFWPMSQDVCCGKTARCIKMPLGTEAGLGLRDIVCDVDPATPRKKGLPTPPNFWPMSIVAKRLDG